MSKFGQLFQQKQEERGFTIVELLMALAVFSFVLVLVTTVFIQIFRTYTRGIVRKEVNQSARLLLDDMTSRMRSMPSSSEVKAPANTGRICFGGYSYVWNMVKSGQPWTSNTINGQAVTSIVRIDGDIGGTICDSTAPNITTTLRPVGIMSNQVGVNEVTISSSAQLAGVRTITVNATTRQADLFTAVNQCKQGVVGSQFCSQITLTETVAQRNR